MQNSNQPPINKKDSHFLTQLKRVYLAFFDKPQTMKEVDFSTGVMRESICRYCRTLKLQNQLYPIRKRYCSITKHLATEYTTNPELILEDDQLKLWE